MTAVRLRCDSANACAHIMLRGVGGPPLLDLLAQWWVDTEPQLSQPHATPGFVRDRVVGRYTLTLLHHHLAVIGLYPRDTYDRRALRVVFRAFLAWTASSEAQDLAQWLASRDVRDPRAGVATARACIARNVDAALVVSTRRRIYRRARPVRNAAGTKRPTIG